MKHVTQERKAELRLPPSTLLRYHVKDRKRTTHFIRHDTFLTLEAREMGRGISSTGANMASMEAFFAPPLFFFSFPYNSIEEKGTKYWRFNKKQQAFHEFDYYLHQVVVGCNLRSGQPER